MVPPRPGVGAVTPPTSAARPLRLLSPVLEAGEGRADYVPTPVAARATVAGVDPRALRPWPTTAAADDDGDPPLGKDAPASQEAAVPNSAAILSAPCPAPSLNNGPTGNGHRARQLLRLPAQCWTVITKATGAAVSTATAVNKDATPVTEPGPPSRSVSPSLATAAGGDSAPVKGLDPVSRWIMAGFLPPDGFLPRGRFAVWRGDVFGRRRPRCLPVSGTARPVVAFFAVAPRWSGFP